MLALPSIGKASATDIYIAQSAQGSANGSSCANAYTYTFFNTSGNWGSGATQIGPGTTVHVCGTITFAGGATGLIFQGSGISGNPVTLLFESGAALEAPYWSGGVPSYGGAIIMSGVSYVTVNGGTNGLVEATLNGTSGGTCPGGTCSYAKNSTGVMFQNCTNCTLENLEVGPIYLRTSTSDESVGGGSTAVVKEGTCNNCTITGNKLHDAEVLISLDMASGTDSNYIISKNNMYNASAGVNVAQGNGATGVISGGFYFYGNSVHDFAAWNDAAGSDNFHHDGVHVYSYTTPLTGINIYDNQFYGDLGQATAWIYYEQYASGTGAMNVFNNLIDYHITSNNSSGGAFSVEVEGSPITTKIYNNTMWGTASSGYAANGIYINSSSITPDIRNNIIGGYFGNIITGSSVASTSNNNVYDATDGAQLNNGSFSAWKSSCGCDSASTNVAPNLDANYKIQSTSSSAYQEGQNLSNTPNSSVNTDLAGVSRPPTGAWDAGAYQYTTGGTPTAPTPPTNLTATPH